MCGKSLVSTAMTALATLQTRFAIPDRLRFEEGCGGLLRAVMTTPQEEAHVYLHGAHVTHYQPRGHQPVLFMSDKSLFATDKPIRGGVPLIFPWFGPKRDDSTAPAHGYARRRDWEVESTGHGGRGLLILVMRLVTDEFTVRHRITLGEDLRLALEVQNNSDKRVRFEEAFHTYLAVGDVRDITVAGLAGATYLDQTDSFKQKTQPPEPIRITSETDRTYLNTRATCVVNDPGARRRILVEKTGSDSTVVWNPWIAKAKALADFGDDEWKRMICIETANVADNAVHLDPGQAHTMHVTIRAEHLP